MSATIYGETAKNEAEARETKQKHKVQAGETLYALSKKYACSIEDLKAANPRKTKNNTIRVGSTLIIPQDKATEIISPVYATKPESEAKPKPIEFVDESSKTLLPELEAKLEDTSVDAIPGIHTIEEGETIYSIARRFKVDHEELIAVNALDPNKIYPGQSILIPKNSDSSPIAASRPATDLDKEFKRFRSTHGGSNYARYRRAQLAPVGLYQYSTGKGLAVWTDGDASDTNLYVLHKEAPMHSVVRVKNPINGRVIYAKVIGELPDTDEYQDVMMQLAPATAKELNMLDDRLILEYSFYE